MRPSDLRQKQRASQTTRNGVARVHLNYRRRKVRRARSATSGRFRVMQTSFFCAHSPCLLSPGCCSHVHPRRLRLSSITPQAQWISDISMMIEQMVSMLEVKEALHPCFWSVFLQSSTSCFMVSWFVNLQVEEAQQPLEKGTYLSAEIKTSSGPLLPGVLFSSLQDLRIGVAVAHLPELFSCLPVLELRCAFAGRQSQKKCDP